MLPALKHNLDSHIFKDDCKMEMAMMQWLITAYKNLYQHGTENYSHTVINGSTLVETGWKSSGIAVQLKISTFIGGENNEHRCIANLLPDRPHKQVVIIIRDI
jgi:hypothetical protein